MLSISDIKTGKKIVLDDEPYEVIYHEHSKTGRAGAVLRTRIKNLMTGSVQDRTFQGSDKVDEADISKSNAQFLYKESENFIFMDQETFDQFELNKDVLGESIDYLIEGLEVTLLNFNDNPINIELPAKIVLTVTDAPPSTKGNTQSGGDKLVVTETGLKVTVPLFIESGDRIIINTEKGSYVSKE